MSGAAKVPEPAWAPPADFDEYRVVRSLGRGRTGDVYLAHDTLLDRAVAVKFIPTAGSEALARFLNEARAAARVQHPNVVGIYRVGQLQERAYLVTEYTRGVGLERLKKPVPWAKALQVATDLARGLAAAHRKGVLHRDVKPGNAILTESGQVKLLDFGLAKVVDVAAPPRYGGNETEELGVQAESLPGTNLSVAAVAATGGLVGTPWYMSPEAWRGEEHTPRSDLYSLGAVIYELCAGRPPVVATTLSALSEAVQSGVRAPLRALAPDVDPRFAEQIDRCLATAPTDRPASADALVEALLAFTDSRTNARVPDGNPYRGLRSFDTEHRSLFFGRKADVAQALERLTAEPFIVLTGDSGVGKSSLAAAAVIPSIEEGALNDGRRYSALRFVPGGRPSTALAHATAAFLKSRPDAVLEWIDREPGEFARQVGAAVRGGAGLVIYVDQLEELVTIGEPADARRFAEALAPLAVGVPGVKLVASARSDFLTRLAGLGAFGEALARSLYLVAPLTSEGLREAIVGPARLKGARFESEALVESLVASAQNQSGGLPLLQFALAQLWDARDQEKNAVTAASLDALGGVSGALARHADAVIEALPPAERGAARTILLRLVTEDETRARRTHDELTHGDPRYVRALEALVRSRLAVGREDGDGATYDVAHEALLTGWRTLANWIDAARDERQLRGRLETAARDWQRAGERSDLVLGERALAEMAPLRAEELSERELRFLHASRSARRRSRWVRFALVSAVLIAVGAAVAISQIRAAIDRSRRIDAEVIVASAALQKARGAEQVEQELRASAYAAFDSGQPKEGEDLWRAALEHATQVDDGYAAATDALERALAVDADRSDVKRQLADLLLSRALRAERDGQPALKSLLAHRLKLVDEDGTRWRRWSAKGVVTLTAPSRRRVTFHRYDVAPAARFALEQQGQFDLAERIELPLEPGSYLFVDDQGARVPVLVARGEAQTVGFDRPSSPPEGFVYVPAGRFLFGTAAEESVRQFLNAAPLHPVELPAYFIGRHETTWAAYLAYLDSLSGSALEERTPRGGSSGLYGGLRIRKLPNGVWELSIQPSGQMFTAKAGEKIRYPDRAERAEVDWLKLPVVGITQDDARAYASWLNQTGQVRGARLCSEREWERAARGPDAREFPHGNRVEPDDANFDLTYGKKPLAFGPDEVGSHPASDSPFGVQDLIGNVWEWTEAAFGSVPAVARGSSYYFGVNSLRVANRELPEPTFRDLTVGMRLCADTPTP